MRVTAKRDRQGWLQCRGYDIKVNGLKVGRVDFREGRFSEPRGWYSSIGSEKFEIPRKSTLDEPVETAEEARDAALAYVRECLSQRVAKATKEGT
jgi:hypothetical protein